ncbi:MAG: minichromosome maintenance protein MCM [Nanoarchaeota archaeon]|nr:minichromosome maintenance protein MCM [Nanoarchaeota archaeon]
MQTEDLILEAKQFFETNKALIGKASKDGEKSVFVEFNTLVDHNPAFAEVLLQKPEEMFRILDIALNETGLIKNAKTRVFNLPEMQYIRVRDVRSKHLGNFVYVEGLVRQASDVRPQVISAKFECPACGSTLSVLQVEKQFREPFRCSCGRRGKFKLVGKELVDAQRLVIEESPDALEGGEQPRRLDVFLKEDLVEPKMERKTTPGSRVRAIGVIKEIPIPLKSGAIMTRFNLAMDANNIIPLEESYEEYDITEEDEKAIKEFAEQKDVYEKLRDMIAPSLFGYEEIKEAISLQLFGGIKKKRRDNTVSRGDIHVLLIGDPGTGKSVMLQFISKNAPKARYVAGRATSSAGLTATVVKDEFLRGWSLEAGALVLANKGILCIDELEKMDPQDRAAAHEALEQQQVTVSKATIQATLRAETTVLAAANPKLGRFDTTRSISEQIDLPPTLINRFDLIFSLKDIPQKGIDEAIADHVLKEHSTKKKVPFDTKFLRKYVAYAKQKVFPQLTEAAMREIKQFYVELRNSVTTVQEGRPISIPISARQLDALIRLAEASARVRLGDKVTREDARRAIKLMHYCLKQVGFDYETQQFDVDRILTGVSATTRSKIFTVKDALIRLEDRIGKKLIPIEDIRKEVSDKGLDPDSVDEIIEKLKRDGDIFEPKKGFVQRI